MKKAKIIQQFSSSPTEYNMSELIKFFKSNSYSDDDIAFLATTLAASGEIVNYKSNSLKADIPSTGGPGSLTTLICPLVLKNIGFIVPKLGIPGRPAGGIDALFQIANYKIHYSTQEVLDCLQKSKYCHFIVGEKHAPLDKVLFDFRSKVNAKSIVPLVIASILSKKIVAGLNITGLDVRVGKGGNFGVTWTEARINSERFIKIAKKVKIKAKCFLNDVSLIPQPFIGRGEALLALLKIFSGNADNLLKEHLFKCIDMSLRLLNTQLKINSVDINSLFLDFKENLSVQGSSYKKFLEKAKEVEVGHQYKIKSTESGILNLDLFKIRDIIVTYQNKFIHDNDKFPDPCGIILKKYQNEFIEKGETILTFRAHKKIKKNFEKDLLKSFTFLSLYPQSFNYETIS